MCVGDALEFKDDCLLINDSQLSLVDPQVTNETNQGSTELITVGADVSR